MLPVKQDSDMWDQNASTNMAVCLLVETREARPQLECIGLTQYRRLRGLTLTTRPRLGTDA